MEAEKKRLELFKSYYVVWKPGQEYYNVADDIV